MKEKPILFSGPMVRAILGGTKTQTRRLVKPRKDANFGCDLAPHEIAGEVNDGNYENCPYGQPGGRLWVRETWAGHHRYDGHKPRHMPAHRVHYAATEPTGGLLVRPSIFMPRWASRITLEVTGVRVERLQDISEADAMAEGIQRTPVGRLVTFEVPGTDVERLHPVVAYQCLWDSLNAKTAPWASNPWVWVIEFRLATTPQGDSYGMD